MMRSAPGVQLMPSGLVGSATKITASIVGSEPVFPADSWLTAALKVAALVRFCFNKTLLSSTGTLPGQTQRPNFKSVRAEYLLTQSLVAACTFAILSAIEPDSSIQIMKSLGFVLVPSSTVPSQSLSLPSQTS